MNQPADYSTRASIGFRAGLHGAVQQGVPALGDDLPIEYFAAALICSPSKFDSVLWISEQHRHRIRENADVLGIDQKAGVAQYLRDPAAFRSDDWSGTGHGLGVHQAKRLLKNRWRREESCALEPCGQIAIVVKIASELDAPRTMFDYRSGQGFHLADIRREGVDPESGAAADHEFRIRVDFQDSGKRFN
jgi:hypothetical protein